MALAPVAAIVIFTGNYASVESEEIDTWYSWLIDHEIKAVDNVNQARSLNTLFGLYLYRLIVATNLERMQFRLRQRAGDAFQHRPAPFSELGVK